jgi:hypothetical protein
VIRVAVRILHAEGATGPLESWLAAARLANAERLLRGFLHAGASDVEIHKGRPDGRSFGARLREIVADGTRAGDGLVVLGSGSIPLARAADFEAFVARARSGERRALANNRYSADAIAIGNTDALRELPDLPGDNALPRWLEEVAGFVVHDLRSRTRLGMDLDSPLDVLLVDGPSLRLGADLPEAELVTERLRWLATISGDRRAELLVAGRTSGRTLRWLERSTACRVRVLVEERGLRASAREALAPGEDSKPQRPARSAIGMLLDDRGPDALGEIVAELADGALIDSRVLLAHRLGADESAWPSAEDRFASDLLLPERIADPWLRALSWSARDASVPIALGGHSLVGPGIRLALRRRR